jgi:hypothetical protein
VSILCDRDLRHLGRERAAEALDILLGSQIPFMNLRARKAEIEKRWALDSLRKKT